MLRTACTVLLVLLLLLLCLNNLIDPARLYMACVVATLPPAYPHEICQCHIRANHPCRQPTGCAWFSSYPATTYNRLKRNENRLKSQAQAHTAVSCVYTETVLHVHVGTYIQHAHTHTHTHTCIAGLCQLER